MSTDLVRPVVEEGRVDVSDGALREIVDHVISKLKEVRSARDFPHGIARERARKAVEILRNYAHADMHVGKFSLTKREMLEWVAGQMLAPVDEGNFHYLNMVLNQLRDFLKVSDSDAVAVLPVRPGRP